LQEADESIVDALSRGDLAGAPVTSAERAFLELVTTLTQHASLVQDDEVERVRQAGWTEPQIAEGVYIAALFAFFNRVADAFGLHDPGYRQMTRSGGAQQSTMTPRLASTPGNSSELTGT
jgi:alkylhydroperoxidase family enzyme